MLSLSVWVSEQSFFFPNVFLSSVGWPQALICDLNPSFSNSMNGFMKLPQHKTVWKIYVSFFNSSWVSFFQTWWELEYQISACSAKDILYQRARYTEMSQSFALSGPAVYSQGRGRRQKIYTLCLYERGSKLAFVVDTYESKRVSEFLDKQAN